MLYFAYGSNMDWGQIQERCPSARFFGVAALRNHQLAFTRLSTKRQCGVADAAPDEGKVVWGVVFEIDDDDLGKLDLAEGYRPGRARNSYRREERDVFINDDDSQQVTVVTYFADPQEKPPLPSSEYKNLILSGARRCQLPDGYIKQLEAIEVAD